LILNLSSLTESIFGYVFLKESIGKSKITGIVFGIGGVVILTIYSKDSSISRNEKLGILLALLSVMA